MRPDPVRARLMALIAHRDPPSDLKRASLACGRNHAYLHQFVHRGTPKRLPEDARHALAAHLGVDEAVLRDDGAWPPSPDPHPNPPFPVRPPGRAGGLAEGAVAAPELRAANIPPGADPALARPEAERWGFPAGWVARELEARPEALRVVAVRGGGMEPDLAPGDRLLVDTDLRRPSPPGLFVLFDGAGLAFRRLELLPGREPPAVRARTPGADGREEEVAADALRVVGRAVWHSRRI